MNGDSGLVFTLVDRLTTRLPHRTGSPSHDFNRDEIVVLTRGTLIGISASCIGTVVEALTQLLEELSQPFKSIHTHPIHVLHSELYILELLAECCAVHWASVNTAHIVAAEEEAVSDSGDSDSDLDAKAPLSLGASYGQNRRAPQNRLLERKNPPGPLTDELVKRLIDAVKLFSRPVPENYILPATNILDDVFKELPSEEMVFNGQLNGSEVSRLLVEKSDPIENFTRGIIEYVSYSNWYRVLEYLKSALQQAAHQPTGNAAQANFIADDDRNALVSIRLISSFWVDGRKLSVVIQELCGSFLHLRKSFQTTVAIVLPLLITRWLERNPGEFIDLHSTHQRLDGGAETLFDMSNTMFDGGRRKAILYPLQTSLLLLLPDVFEYASNMRVVKNSSSIAKKVSFLELLRKALRNRNETAIYCLTSVLRVARHFPLDNDAAILSYALDVQEEVGEAVFRRYNPSMDAANIGTSLMCAAFVSLVHLDFESCVESLTPICLASNAPQDFKIAVISACSHLARQTNADEYLPLFMKLADFVRDQLRVTALRRRDSYADEQYTKLKPLEVANSADLVYTILLFLDASSLTLFNGAPSFASDWLISFEETFATFSTYLATDDERIRNLANTVARKIMSEGTMSFWRKSKGGDSKPFTQKFWRTTSAITATAADSLIGMGNDETGTLIFIHDYLESRLHLLKTITELTEVPDDVPERAIACTKLETAFLISLCSSDISVCQLVTKCISLFCEEAHLVDDSSAANKSSVPTIRNIDKYLEISTRGFRFTGLVAFQKRVRGILRQIHYPTAGILIAWETVFEYWFRTSKQIFSRSSDMLEEKLLVEWRNCSGFLASLGGACTSDLALTSEDSSLTGLRWIDRILPDTCDETLLSKYMKQSIQLLASNNVRIREATRETLSTELSPLLYFPLFEALESELGVLFDTTRTNTSLSIDSRVIFAEQAAALLKSIVERLGGPAETGSPASLDVGTLTLNFAKFLDDLAEGASILKVKIKICQLCETVTQKKELLNLRNDVRVRNQLLEVIFSWIARPGSPKDAVISAGARVEELHRLQRDLDRACLKALADLTYRLPLQPAEGQTDADTSDLKSQMFHTYFNRFLSLLNFETAESGRNEGRSMNTGGDESLSPSELAISALSNLLSANIDVGLKHSLGIGYHEDIDIRTAFVKVLCNILIQGAEFNNLSDSAVNERYDELLELLINDMSLTIALCDACPSMEVDEMTISLLNIFDSRGLAFVLLEALLEHEVEETENEAELLRRNCVATKMLSVYAKWKGAAYLKATLQRVLERLVLTSKDLDLELDPARTSSPEELQKNALQLRVVAKVFIDDICNSAAHIPVSFRKICSIISSTVMKRFPDAKFTAVGAFIFLRFFCPAIVAPDVEGLITTAPSKEMRRGLLLIAKVVQNLANNVLFGAKEPYMFPLNDFLTQNIYRVTTFLREISVPPNMVEPIIESESFDFGSCVAMHRFLYDNWDHVRQKIVIRERKGADRSLLDATKSHVPILDALRKLITNLGPPPMNVSWNRPAISSNSPPSYSRFQHFMLRNAGRNTESLVSTRAVYDGGESKVITSQSHVLANANVTQDGLPMICIILRNIDTEATDYELLLFGYLKIASRMWHRPFGVLLDATCYSGQNEPQDALFRKLDLLTPSELTKQLSRVYVYNMNSAFRKCFRRILRLAAKSENSAFHPKNVDYHLIGSLQDLQAHFHLSQLHLPKETISVVTDTRFVFQPIVRLSKTKGKIEVVIKVGSQFVQVTTTKKQEVVPGLRLHATVNDIFRLSEVDEAPTSIQTEDDSAFGLRTENGKIVMYFTSPRKPDVLQAIRGAKAKYGKELRTLSSFERLVRPQDVPGTLLNIALTNMASSDSVLRLAAYDLLCALCRAFKFAADSKFLSAKELCVPLNPTRFIIDISERLAQSEPQLTADFLNEFFVGWESFPYSQRPISLAYMAPWLPGLRTSLIPNDVDSDKAREKVAAIFRRLIEVAISDVALGTTLEQHIWPAITSDEIYTDIFLDEIVKAALSFGMNDERTEVLGSIISSLGTVSVRGKLISRLRKALNRTSLRPTRHLPENTVWGEICILIRLCLLTSFDSGSQSQLYLPELFHLVTMLANTGSLDVRLSIHRLLISTVHAMCTALGLEEGKTARLKDLLTSLSESWTDSLFNIPNRDGVSVTSSQDSGIPSLTAIESLAVVLSEISTVAAVTVDMSNAWRSRWMSLVASTAFQSNPAIQPRAFTVMGCLAREEVDDDLLYQVLVALRSSTTRFMEENDSEMLIAIVISLTKMMDKLPPASRYGMQMFWLALSLVRLVPLTLFNCTALFLDAVLNNIAKSGDFQGGRMVPTLLQGRTSLEDAALQLDEFYGIHFNVENFHFAVCASLVKGLTDSVTKATAIRVLTTFLETTTSNSALETKSQKEMSAFPYLGLLISRAMTPEESKENLWLAGWISNDDDFTAEGLLDVVDLETIKDKELLLNAAISIVDFQYLEDMVQNRGLLWLNRVAEKRPTVVLHLCGPIIRILDDILISCQNAVTLESAHLLMRTLTSNPKFTDGVDTSEMLEDVLDGIGFGGLWRSSTFHIVNEHDRQSTAVTDRLIELIIA
ncbi:related to NEUROFIBROMIN [Rhynchosporium secalis]|uniref:Related to NEUROFIBROMIN n=1 Tax=Rhynchosporium secalis TaxID=38038 RepID=A0A1E1MAV0_RHYSE|nr:related to NEUROFIBROMIN [Rhynchosporium secalis]